MMYNKTVLKNGIRIVSEKLDYFRSISLGIWVDVGSRNEMEEENGISHFIEHMIFKGTHNRNSFQIAKELDAIGGMSNAFTGKESTCFYSKVLDKHFPKLADILSDIFMNSLFDQEEMDREMQVILQEINLVEDTPDEHIHGLFSSLFWMGHSLGMPILGTGKTVSAIKHKTILNYVKRFYTPGKIIIAAAGNIDHESMLNYFKPLFESLPPGDNNSRDTLPEINSAVSCNIKDLGQVHICLGGGAAHQSSDKRFSCAVLNTILGGNMSSRLFQEIREKRGLAYSIYSFFSAYIDTGLLGIYVGTNASDVNKVLEVINTEIRKLQRGEISKSDMDIVRENLVGGIFLGSESPDARMMRLARNEYVFGRNISHKELAANIEKVTIDEVVAIACDIFQSDKVSLTTLGPLKREALDLSCLQFADA